MPSLLPYVGLLFYVALTFFLGAYRVFTTISSLKARSRKVLFWAHSALSDLGKARQRDDAVARGAAVGRFFLVLTRRQGLSSSSSRRRAPYPAPVGIIVPINWDSCPGVRKVMRGAGGGKRFDHEATTASMPCFPHRNSSGLITGIF
jgi:hypothetical protein